MLPGPFVFRWRRIHAPGDGNNIGPGGQQIPCPRSGHTVVSDELRKPGPTLYLYGGYDPFAPDGRRYLSDVWSFDVTSSKWSKRQTTGDPPSLYSHTATLVGNKIFVVGGFDGKETRGDLRTLTIPADKKAPVVHEQPNTLQLGDQVFRNRRDHTAVLAGSRVLVFGGFDAGAGCYSDVSVLYRKTMQFSRPPVAGVNISGRRGHTAALAGSSVVVCGGATAYEQYFNDVYLLQTMAMTWSKPECTGDLPRPRAWHTASFLNNYLVVYGGLTAEGGVVDDVCVLDLETMSWERVTVEGDAPPARYAHTATVVGTDIVVFGGKTIGNVALNDLWVLETNLRNTLEAVAGSYASPRPLSGAASPPEL